MVNIIKLFTHSFFKTVLDSQEMAQKKVTKRYNRNVSQTHENSQHEQKYEITKKNVSLDMLTY